MTDNREGGERRTGKRKNGGEKKERGDCHILARKHIRSQRQTLPNKPSENKKRHGLRGERRADREIEWAQDQNPSPQEAESGRFLWV